jgi:hypothetical protein
MISSFSQVRGWRTESFADVMSMLCTVQMIWSDRGRARAAETSISSASVRGGQRVIGGVGLGETGEGMQTRGGEEGCVRGSDEMEAGAREEGVSVQWCGEEEVRGEPWERLASSRLCIWGMDASTCAEVNGGAIMRYWDR